MKKQKNKYLSNLLTGASALALLILSVMPAFFSAQTVYAAGEVEPRSITMGSSVPAATTTYTVNFKTATAGLIEGVVVDFCSQSPIINYQCTTTAGTTFAGFSVGSTPAISTPSGLNSGTWTASSKNSGRTLTIENSGATTSVAAGTTVSFNITTVTNPNTVGTFYGRILTYSSTTDATAYTSTSDGAGVEDTGGVALTTANNINVQAIVEEQLSFCVSGTTMTSATNCTSATPANVNIGSGSPLVLSSSSITYAPAYTQLDTNAINGASVDLYQLGSWSCVGLSDNSGSSCGLPGLTTLGTPAANTAFFGLCVDSSTLSTGGSGSITPTTNYNGCSTTNQYYIGATVNTTPDEIMSSTAPCEYADNTINFGAQSSPTTPAGVYTAQENLIATGTF